MSPGDGSARRIAHTPWGPTAASAFMSPFRIADWCPPDVVVGEGGEGEGLDDVLVTLDDTFIISDKLAKLLTKHVSDHIQLLGVNIVNENGKLLNDGFSLLVVSNQVDCLDYSRSMRCLGGRWLPCSMVVDPCRVPRGPAIFRVQGWHSIIAVDDLMIDILEGAGVVGLYWWSVVLSTDDFAPAPACVPGDVVSEYRNQWKNLPRFRGW